MKTPLDVLFLTDGIDNPASRYRCEQFFDHFEANGVRCTMRYAYGSLYNTVFDTRVGALYKLASRARRAFHTVADVDRWDVIFLQRTAFPQTALPERLLARRRGGLIFDFDDSLWLGPGGVESDARRRAFDDAARLSDHLIAGNRFLRDEAGRPDATTVVPTVIDTDRYTPAPAGSGAPGAGGDEVIIGWMGTAGNFPFLTSIAPALRATLDRHPQARLRMVSNADFAPLADHPRVEQIRWSKDREIALLQSFDIGLMPLDDGPLTRGKCAFKMIQYMAVGAPVVVSAVGANVEVAEGTELGYVLGEGESWEDALDALIASPEDRRRMGQAGRERAVERYSIEAVLPTYLDLFRRHAA